MSFIVCLLWSFGLELNFARCSPLPSTRSGRALVHRSSRQSLRQPRPRDAVVAGGVEITIDFLKPRPPAEPHQLRPPRPSATTDHQQHVDASSGDGELRRTVCRQAAVSKRNRSLLLDRPRVLHAPAADIIATSCSWRRPCSHTPFTNTPACAPTNRHDARSSFEFANNEHYDAVTLPFLVAPS